MQLPIRHNLIAYRGDSWTQGFRFVRDGAPVDLASATVEAEARAADDSTTALLVEIVDASDGRVRLTLPPELPAATYTYDVEVTDGAVVTTWVCGRLTLERDVTNER